MPDDEGSVAVLLCEVERERRWTPGIASLGNQIECAGERGILPTECSRERRRYKSRYRLLRSLLLRRPCSLSRHATRGSRPPRRGPQTQRQTRGESFCTTQCGLQVLMVHRTNPWLNQSAGRRLPQKTFPATKAMGHSVPVLL